MSEPNFKFSKPLSEETNKYRWQSQYFAEGGCRYAFAGRINKGYEAGTRIVVKKWKDYHVFDSDFWDQEIATHQKAKELIDGWNDAGFIDKKYVTHVPFKIVCVNSPNKMGDKAAVVKEQLVGEKYIDGFFEKWNSNSGYVDASTASVQAFCHWTYHYSNGTLLMCDAQGVRRDTQYIITDPCICSLNQAYGLTDCGEESIHSFFANHECNEFCKSWWRKPTYIDKNKLLPKKKTSTYRFQKTRLLPYRNPSNAFSKLSSINES